MPRILFVLTAWLATCLPADAQEAPPPWVFHADKAAHFGVSYVLADQGARLGLSPGEALALALFVGWAKEVADARVDAGDLAFDALGAGLATFGRWETRF